MTKLKSWSILICAVITCSFLFTGCISTTPRDNSLPSLNEKDGWYETMNDDFGKVTNLEETHWRPQHGKRHDAYWCDNMIFFEDGALVINSKYKTDSQCDDCPKEGVFSGAINTVGMQTIYDSNGIARDESVEYFTQAFGYFEATVKVPTGSGMWSAFWLQSPGTGKIGNEGKDGTEIDIYESSFQKNPTKTGSALHYDAYKSPFYRMNDQVTDVGYSLYDGKYHKYSMLWSPEYYVFYVDDKPTWTTDFGGVSRVPEYLRLTVEMKTPIGPYGQNIGEFANVTDDSNKFFIKQVRVFQNTNYESFILSNDAFENKRSEYTTYYALLYTAFALVAVGIAVGVTIIIISQKRKKTRQINNSQIDQQLTSRIQSKYNK